MVQANCYKDDNCVPLLQALPTIPATASTVAGTATATVTGATGYRVVATNIIASYSSSTQAGTVTVKDGTTTLFVIPFVGQVAVTNLFPGIMNTKSADMSMVLSAGGGGVTGAVTFMYFAVRA